MINLGDKVRDRVTGFEGIAIGETRWLTGCKRYVVQPEVGKDGKLCQAESFDEPMLEVVKANKVKPAVVEDKKPGGPRPTPKQH